MSNRDGKGANRKKRDKYHKKGGLCPRCKRGHLMGCDQQHKEGHKHHVFCPVCKDCNF